MFQNSSKDTSSLHSHQKIFEADIGYHQREIFLIPICALAVLENLVVCGMIYYYKRLRNTTNVFIFGLCVTNCLFAGVLLPMHCFQKANMTYLYLTIIIILIYICNLTAVTLKRYIAIIRPLHYVNIITKRRAVRVVVFCYLFPTAYCLIPMAWDGSKQSINHKIYISFTLVVFLILPLVFIISVYVKVYRETHKFYKKHRALFQKQKKSLKNDDHFCGQQEQTSLLQEASFICCLFTKTIKYTSSIRCYNSDVESTSTTSDSETVLDNSTTLIRHQSSLYKKVLRMSTTIGESSTFDDDSPRDVFENTNNDHKQSLIIDKKILGEKERNASFQRRASVNNDLCKKPDRGVEGASLPGSMHLKRSLGASHSFESFKVHTVKKYRQAKVRLTELKASLAFAMVSLSYMFTWLPVVYMTFLDVIDRMDHIPPWLSTISIYTIGFSTMIDPLLYGFMLRDFRQAIKSTLRKRRRRSIKR